MYESFTLLLLLQHYPASQQLHVISHEDLAIDADISDYLQTSEQHINQYVLDDIYSFAASALQ